MAKQIFYVMYCDEWRSHDSERLAWIGTSPQKTKMFISQAIERQDIQYGDTEVAPKKQAAQFRKDWAEKPRDYINNTLWYGFYDYVHDNEEV